MRVHIVYAHPSSESFTHAILTEFVRGLTDAGHEHTISDLYAMEFQPLLTREQYQREASYRADLPVPDDVAAEHAKLEATDAWVFVYPVWWTDCPAILKGWFDRVWSAGYAYLPCAMKQAELALVLCPSGHTIAELQASGRYQAMETTMLGDRIADRAKQKVFHLFGGSETLADDDWAKFRAAHLEDAYRLGRDL